MPKVSVICTNYNKGKWIADAIDSFLRQKTTFEFEIILVDDCSTDESVDIIRDYERRYPEQIRTFFNAENQGIAKTWVAICKEARGQYIARCDGDDYWIDDEKLQKQVEILDKSETSSWSCSDFDIISESGEFRHKEAIKNGIIRKMSSFEEILAFRGMTMSSTWLVDRKLMLEVNEAISPDTVDDTFCLQLELFTKTELTFLSEATTVYRLHEGSDSHPASVEKISKRFEKLQETQEEYLEKYYSLIDFNVLTRYLFLENTEHEKILALRKQELATQLNNAQAILNELLEERNKLRLTEENLKIQIAERDHWLNEYNKVVHSKRWIISTKIINLFRRNR
ncbi:glycosyltransferase family 2 protein [Streptococcus sp. FT1-106]|uniref:glycosyltransferase family 2 protein n=1 Tax=Streptococcus sp. FT1-106 TaxID=3409994 RepID=UPI003BF4805B